eukprot:366130-Chlamydomonas_euryale.AAC.8
MQILSMGLKDVPPGSINILCNASCSEIRQTSDGGLQLIADVDGKKVMYEPNLLIGADGLNSSVRQALHDIEPENFSMHVLDSPSAGLRFKVLRLPAHPPGSKDGSLRLQNSSIARVSGNNGLGLGLLPQNDDSDYCTANIILKPDHPFWDIKSVEALYECLESSFPQMPIREIIPQEEAERFLACSGGAFPKPQYCKSLHKLLSRTDASKSSPSQGVLLVGDAAHSFPPDLGQGVNSGFEDVVVLNKVLEECNDQIEVALPMFEERRLPDVKALVEIMVWGGPYQYRQDQVKASMWFMRLAAQSIFNKLLPMFVPPPVIVMMQNRNYSYREIAAQQSALATRGFQILAAAAAAACAVLIKQGQIA